MKNEQLVDLHEVEAYWKSRGLMNEKYLPYYIRWLQRFLVGAAGDPRLGPEDAERAFVESLERGGTPEWQVRQAARAVELYQKHYLCFRQEQGLATAGDDSGGNPPQIAPSGSLATLEAAMQEFVAAEQIKIGQIIHAVRVAVTGKSIGLGVFDSLAILGKPRCLRRIKRALAKAQGKD